MKSKLDLLDMFETVEQVAYKYEVHNRTVRYWCENGLLEARKINNDWLIVKDQELKTKEKTNEDWEKIKIKNLKTSVGEFNRWQRAARIYFDSEEMRVDTFIYQDLNNWQEFNDPAVVEVFNKDTFSTQQKITMKELKKICYGFLGKN